MSGSLADERLRTAPRLSAEYDAANNRRLSWHTYEYSQALDGANATTGYATVEGFAGNGATGTAGASYATVDDAGAGGDKPTYSEVQDEANGAGIGYSTVEDMTGQQHGNGMYASASDMAVGVLLNALFGAYI